MILLDSARHGAASPEVTGLLLGFLGLLAVWGGIRIRNARIPDFVTTYTGRASGALALPFTGTCLLCLGIAGVGDSFPSWVKGLIGLGFPSHAALALLGTLIWFPRFLLPPGTGEPPRRGFPATTVISWAGSSSSPRTTRRSWSGCVRSTGPGHPPPIDPATRRR